MLAQKILSQALPQTFLFLWPQFSVSYSPRSSLLFFFKSSPEDILIDFAEREREREREKERNTDMNIDVIKKHQLVDSHL